VFSKNCQLLAGYWLGQQINSNIQRNNVKLATDLANCSQLTHWSFLHHGKTTQKNKFLRKNQIEKLLGKYIHSQKCIPAGMKAFPNPRE
jgi:hypothetical protein